MTKRKEGNESRGQKKQSTDTFQLSHVSAESLLTFLQKQGAIHISNMETGLAVLESLTLSSTKEDQIHISTTSLSEW